MASTQSFSSADVRKHTSNGDLWLVINGMVHDVSEFLDDHPGGADALLDQSGIDATRAFEDVGHSGDARKIMESFIIGRAEKMDQDTRTSSGEFMRLEEGTSNWTCLVIACALLLVLGAAYTLF